VPARGLFIVLCPPRSYSSVVTAMLGRHPQLYAMAENGLLFHDRMSDWRECHADHPHFWPGARRTVAELLYGGLSDTELERSDALLRGEDGSPARIVGRLAEAASPRLLLDKSPLELPTGQALNALAGRWPDAHFLHLVRHPHESIRSMMAYPSSRRWAANSMAAMAPLMWWSAHQGARRLLERLPAGRGVRVRAEDVLRDPAGTLAPVLTAWGLRADADALTSLAHPGGAGGSLRPDLGGADPSFLSDPALRPIADPPARLLPEGAVSSPTLDRQIAALAQAFGYDGGSGWPAATGGGS